MKYIEVLINKRIFTYQSSMPVEIGAEVLVPFRRHRASGYVVGIVEKPGFETKSIVDVVRPKPQFTSELAQLSDWIADYYKCYRAKAFELVLPKVV
ncbi:hypothetical protein ACFL4D_01505 [Candidatus Margulisiibacteriota bacterium]